MHVSVHDSNYLPRKKKYRSRHKFAALVTISDNKTFKVYTYFGTMFFLRMYQIAYVTCYSRICYLITTEVGLKYVFTRETAVKLDVHIGLFEIEHMCKLPIVKKSKSKRVDIKCVHASSARRVFYKAKHDDSQSRVRFIIKAPILSRTRYHCFLELFPHYYYRRCRRRRRCRGRRLRRRHRRRCCCRRRHLCH